MSHPVKGVAQAEGSLVSNRGGPGLLPPPPALKMIAEDYQQGLLDRLNDQVRGTVLENKSIVQTLVDAARDPNKVLEFNYASEALNNSFFLENLPRVIALQKPPPENATSHEGELRTNDVLFRRIVFHYGSLAHFQSSFSAAVLGMFSSGWIWLVSDAEGQLGIVPTFGAGTLLVRSGQATKTFEEWQRSVGEPTLPADDLPSLSKAPSGDHLNNASSPMSGITHAAPPLDPHTPARSISYHARPSGIYDHPQSSRPLNQTEMEPRKVGEVIYPLLCVSVHEHAWVGAGYGVWGKEEYMKRFWTVVDWKRVKDLYRKISPKTHM
ncbi:Manganese/iron superoxide dismutase [Daedaleopsis nitida]|nr:Manganese/iron superoxide dismutase [Daedaleopsis nitida]